MKRLFTRILMLAILAMSAASVAEARESARRLFSDWFDAMDQNADRAISEYEYTRKMSGQAKERARREFRERDKNSDGALHMKEFGKH